MNIENLNQEAAEMFEALKNVKIYSPNAPYFNESYKQTFYGLELTLEKALEFIDEDYSAEMVEALKALAAYNYAMTEDASGFYESMEEYLEIEPLTEEEEEAGEDGNLQVYGLNFEINQHGQTQVNVWADGFDIYGICIDSRILLEF